MPWLHSLVGPTYCRKSVTFKTVEHNAIEIGICLIIFNHLKWILQASIWKLFGALWQDPCLNNLFKKNVLIWKNAAVEILVEILKKTVTVTLNVQLFLPFLGNQVQETNSWTVIPTIVLVLIIWNRFNIFHTLVKKYEQQANIIQFDADQKTENDDPRDLKSHNISFKSLNIDLI